MLSFLLQVILTKRGIEINFGFRYLCCLPINDCS